MDEKEQLKKIVTRLSAEIANLNIRAAAAEALAEMRNDAMNELQQKNIELQAKLDGENAAMKRSEVHDITTVKK